MDMTWLSFRGKLDLTSQCQQLWLVDGGFYEKHCRKPTAVGNRKEAIAPRGESIKIWYLLVVEMVGDKIYSKKIKIVHLSRSILYPAKTGFSTQPYDQG